MPPHDWNAADYDQTNDGIVALGLEVLSRLELTGDETVLDAGCGTGALTAEIADRLPNGTVYALDAAPQMIEQAARRFAGRERVAVVRGDLNDFDLGGARVDVIFSNAALHWIKDHDRLFRNFREVIRRGGRIMAQCGGEGNIAEVQRCILAISDEEPFRDYVGDWLPTFFAGAAETERRLRGAGFNHASCWLEDRVVTPADPAKHLREIVLGAHFERLPERLREPFAEAVERMLGEWTSLDYVRLNVEAIA